MKTVFKITLLSVFWLMASAGAGAQSFRKILDRPHDVVKSVWESDNEGNQELNYYNEDYCPYYLYREGDDSYELQPGKNTVFKKMKKSPYDNPFNRPTSFMYFRGFFPKDFQVNTPYAMPIILLLPIW